MSSCVVNNIFPTNLWKKILTPEKFKKEKYLIYAWTLSLNESNCAIRAWMKLDGDRQKDRQTEKVSHRGAPILKIDGGRQTDSH